MKSTLKALDFIYSIIKQVHKKYPEINIGIKDNILINFEECMILRSDSLGEDFFTEEEIVEKIETIFQIIGEQLREKTMWEDWDQAYTQMKIENFQSDQKGKEIGKVILMRTKNLNK